MISLIGLITRGDSRATISDVADDLTLLFCLGDFELILEPQF